MLLTKIFKHFLNGSLISVHHDTFLVQHQDVHGQPLGGHPEWVIYDKSNCYIIQLSLLSEFLNDVSI